MRRRALITGISGQDGHYMSQLLLQKGYEVHGATRDQRRQLASGHVDYRVQLHGIDPTDGDVWNRLICELRPAELYHFAADSFVPNGWETPLTNLDANTGTTVRILDAIRHYCPETRFLNACSREVFGSCVSKQANEETPMQPNNPYGIHKAAARWMVNAYRERYDLFATNAILFNHESPRRSERFVTRKISKRVAEIAMGLESDLALGNLCAERDWGFAGDFVDAMWRMLDIDQPHDFVIGTGITHSIEQFLHTAFSFVHLDWPDFVASRSVYTRVQDSAALAADTDKAFELLGWSPKVDFQQLVEMMVASDIEEIGRLSRRAA